MPLVLCTVMALIYLALFNMQEYMMMYEAQRVSAVVAREEAYIGYDVFRMGADNEIDFNWGDGNVPSADTVTSYYTSHNESLSKMYREIGSVLNMTGIPGIDTRDYMNRFGNAARDASLLALGTISQPEIDIDYGLLGTSVTVTFKHALPMPGVVRYLGLDDNMTLYVSAYTWSQSPSGFARNVDLAEDLVSYIFEKLGMSDKYNGFVSKTKEVLQKIL